MIVFVVKLLEVICIVMLINYIILFNNLKHYKNKMYRYNYDIDRYYYQDNNNSEVYDEKQRVKLGELSKKELEEVLNIEKIIHKI